MVQASEEGVPALAEALFRYHRGITFLSGNTITPLLRQGLEQFIAQMK